METFSLFLFQRLWNNNSHKKESLNEDIPRKIFELNLKKELYVNMLTLLQCSANSVQLLYLLTYISMSYNIQYIFNQ